MRVTQWGHRPAYPQVLKKRVTREIEDRGQLLVLIVFLLLWALSTRTQALSWLLGGIAALVSFHANTVSIERARGAKEPEHTLMRRRSLRRRMFAVGTIIVMGYLIHQVEFTTLVTGIFATKLALYFLAPRRFSWRPSSMPR